ncbi:hypothetical protein [Cohnella cellulosilytica]|uniref:Uncharacterized protein n=1 Tax=Cohnella cellulosilytica TaxID=986710 RepID=A0ABW2FFG7_9BACL
MKNAEGIALDKAVVSPSFAAGTVLTVTSAATIKVGDTVTFKVDKPETVKN